MVPEVSNVRQRRPDERPSPFGVTVAVDSPNKDAETLLEEVRAVWEVAATWGRWRDEELGEWPSLDECVKGLPAPFASRISCAPHVQAEGWFDALRERDWIWWSGAVIDNYIKIDLASDSFPLGTFALSFVVDAYGGRVVFSGLWVDSETLLKRLAGQRSMPDR